MASIAEIPAQIADGDAASSIDAFTRYGDQLSHQADVWQARGWQQQSAEMCSSAFASYRPAWQFAPCGQLFLEIQAKERSAFGNRLTWIPCHFLRDSLQGQDPAGRLFQERGHERTHHSPDRRRRYRT